MSDFASVGLALLGGILPALAWLWFWRREDSRNPEPRRLIALAFFAGMVTVAAVIPIQKFVAPLLGSTTIIFIVWSVIEEAAKYIAARITVLRQADYDEPIDAVIYMITIALGFAAVENALFLLSPLAGDNVLSTILTGNLRFVGATLLHVLSSGAIGLALALSFYKSRRTKSYFAIGGVILAAVLHSFFNFLILNTQDENVYRTFALVWIGVVALLAILEFVKRTQKPINQYRTIKR